MTRSARKVAPTSASVSQALSVLRVVEPAELRAAVEMSRRVYCSTCPDHCSGLMHRGADGSGACLLCPSCQRFTPETT